MISDPVFVDRSGRRRRLMMTAGIVGSLTLLLAVGTLLAGLTGDGPAAVPGWPAPAATRATDRPAVAPATTGPSPSPTRRKPAPPAASRTPTPSAEPSAVATKTRPANRGRKPSSRPSRNR